MKSTFDVGGWTFVKDNQQKHYILFSHFISLRKPRIRKPTQTKDRLPNNNLYKKWSCNAHVMENSVVRITIPEFDGRGRKVVRLDINVIS